MLFETKRLILRRLSVNDDEARAYITNGPVRSYADNGFGLYLAETKRERIPIGICGCSNASGCSSNASCGCCQTRRRVTCMRP